MGMKTKLYQEDVRKYFKEYLKWKIEPVIWPALKFLQYYL
jgi:hypothetical protein